MNAEGYQVLLVSPNRRLLRQLSGLLDQYGYGVTSTMQFDDALGLMQAGEIHFLLLDAAAVPCIDALGAWRSASTSAHVHTLLLAGEEWSGDVQEAFELGVDDFLRLPVSTAELLTRLRSAARYAELERRLGQLQWLDPLTRLYSAPALLQHLESLATTRRPHDIGLLLLQPDYFTQVLACCGQRGADRLCTAVASVVHNAGASLAAHLKQSQVALVLPDHSTTELRQTAEQLRAAVSALDVSDLALPFRLTASAAVARGCDGDRGPQDLLLRAQQALRQAQISGHDATLCSEELEEDVTCDESQSGGARNRFATSQARDVLAPFTAYLRPNDSLQHAAKIFANTTLPLLPVINSQSVTCGMVLREQVVGERVGDKNQRVEQLRLRDVPTVPENAPFVSVLEQFMNKETTLLVVMRGNTALGFIERASFSNLLKPISPSWFATNCPDHPASRYLSVPDFTSNAP